MEIKNTKNKIIEQFCQNSKDTGSCEIQVALLSERIRQISEHLKQFPKDMNSQYGLIKLVGRRRSFLNYLKKNSIKSYEDTVQKLKEQKYL
jgi:small subunit ribosomal protein S15